MKRLSIIVIIGIFIIIGCDWQRTSKEPSKNAQNQQVIKIGYLPITHSANLMMTKKNYYHNTIIRNITRIS